MNDLSALVAIFEQFGPFGAVIALAAWTVLRAPQEAKQNPPVAPPVLSPEYERSMAGSMQKAAEALESMAMRMATFETHVILYMDRNQRKE